MSNHYIGIKKSRKKWAVTLGEETIAESDKVLELSEKHPSFNVKPVLYFPYDSVKKEFLEKSDTTSKCPIKGTASYFSIKANDNLIKDILWTYEEPLSPVSSLKDYFAFYFKDGVELTEFD